MTEEPVEIDTIVDSLRGRTILGGGLDDRYEGFHLALDDGRVFIVTGTFIVGVYHRHAETMQ